VVAMKRSQKAGIFSAIIWGSGQVYNRQYIKGIILFLIQALIILRWRFFNDNLWGLITLGETETVLKDGLVLHGDNSIVLLILGLIALTVIAVAIPLYIFNIKDAARTAKQIESTGTYTPEKEWLAVTWEKSFPYIVLFIPALFILFLCVVPLLFGFLTAFTNYSAPEHLPPRHLVDWVGFQNFKDIFSVPIWNDTFWGVAAWTLVWALASTFTCFFGGLLIAVIINSKRVKFKKFWRTIYILPWAIPQLVTLLVFRNMFNGQFGPINQLLRQWGIIEKNIPWFSDSTIAKITIIVINIWLGFPYFMAMMTGVMTSISQELYEAAAIDGATVRQQFWKITMPLVLYATSPLLIMSFAGNFNNFSVIYFLTGGNPINPSYKFAGSTDILITWIYKLTKDNRQFHMASVMSILIFVLVGSISTWNFLQTKTFKEEDMM
jgi:arabinogalactan oligomer/maltooligosaccharide transport system permease protein